MRNLALPLLAVGLTISAGSPSWSSLTAPERGLVATATKYDEGSLWKSVSCPKGLKYTVESVATSKDAPLDLQAVIKTAFTSYAADSGTPAKVTVSVTKYKTGFLGRATCTFDLAVRDEKGGLLLALSDTVESKSSDFHGFGDSDSKIVAEKLFRALRDAD